MTMKADTLVIVNPCAGGGSAARRQTEVADYFASQGHSVAFSESANLEDIRCQAAHAVSDGFRFVLALGGDGAAHQVIEGLLGTAGIAGILPAGNGNDIARELGIPLDPISAADAFLHSEVRLIDVIRATFADGREAHILAAGGMGLDAEAAHLANTTFRNWPGVSRYLAGALTAFFKSATFEVRAVADGRLWSGRALLVVVANGPFYGAGLRIAPEAQIDDGTMDILFVRPVGWTRFLEAIPMLLTSGDLRFPEIERCTARKLRLESDRPIRVHGDGDFLGESPVDLEIIPKAIRIAVPR